MPKTSRCVVSISSLVDVEHVRREARNLATHVGFNREDAESIVLAVSELAMNLVQHAHRGEIIVSTASREGATGIIVQSADAGPGIMNVELALSDGFSTRGGLGSGLPAVRRLMDDFTITTNPSGTRIEACKWLSKRSSSR
jgi:serine/threonine-protein kinase RsbT